MTVAAIALFLISAPMIGLYAFIGISHNPVNWRRYFPFFILTVFVLSYTYNPPHEMDLTRYFDAVKECAAINSLEAFLKYGNDGLIVRNLFFWIIGKLGDVHLLPAVSTAVVYGVSGYITCDTASEYRITKLIPSLFLFQLLMLPLVSILSNVRNIFSFSLISLAAYFDLIKGQRTIKVILLYILPCGIHISAVLLVILRFLVPVIKRKKMIAVGAAFFILPVINWAYNIVSTYIPHGNIGIFVKAAITKAYDYSDNILSDYERTLLTGIYPNLQKFFMMSFALLLLALALYYLKYVCTSERWEKYSVYCFLICLMTLSCNIFTAPNYWRFYCATVITSPVIMVPLIKERKNHSWVIQILPFGFFGFMLGGLLMNLWNFYGAANLVDWFSGFLLTNLYTIIFRIMKGVLNLL